MALTDAAIKRIKEMIVSGELRPGERLPREADLASRLGLSRNSLREAVKALSLVRILDVRQGDGTYVTSLQPEVLLDSVSFVLDFYQGDSVLHLLEMRRILEPEATAMAAQMMSDEEIERLGDLVGIADVAQDVDSLLANDLDFHRRVAAGSGNPVLAAFIDSLNAPALRSRIWRSVTREDLTGRLHKQHGAIHGAIAGRQPDLARAWAIVHVADVESCFRRGQVPPRQRTSTVIPASHA